jgi:hypothetical protein
MIVKIARTTHMFGRTVVRREAEMLKLRAGVVGEVLVVTIMGVLTLAVVGQMVVHVGRLRERAGSRSVVLDMRAAYPGFHNWSALPLNGVSVPVAYVVGPQFVEPMTAHASRLASVGYDRSVFTRCAPAIAWVASVSLLPRVSEAA